LRRGLRLRKFYGGKSSASFCRNTRNPAIALGITRSFTPEKVISEMISIQGQVAIITGGSRGIGAACAIYFAKAGADVVITYAHHRTAAENIAAKVEALGRTCLAVKADIAKEKSARLVVEKTIKKFGKIDILVNNAAIWTFGEIGNFPAEVWKETMEVNVNGTFYMTNAVVPSMKERKSGKIINITSTAGQRGEAQHSHYAASKGALISFTKAISTELAPFNITVNSVAPGWVDTGLNAEIFKDRKFKEAIRKGIPLGRIPTPEDIAGPVLFLASDLARHITGEIMNVNGGSVLVG
jgi:3-oxoacyl-[acyl-carrier protein] reductase